LFASGIAAPLITIETLTTMSNSSTE